AMKLTPNFGPPTSSVTIKGSGFGAFETVDLEFDAEAVGMAATNGRGSFSQPIAVPGTALPGAHSVTATGEISGLVATAPFTWRTDWPKFHFDLANSGVNPYENILGPSNVSDLLLNWTSVNLGGQTSPAVVNGVVYESSSNGKLYALDAGTGFVLWKYG